MNIRDTIKNNKVLIIILLIGIFFRVIDLDRPFYGIQMWPEAHYSMKAENFFKYGLFKQYADFGVDYTTPPLVPWFIFLSFNLFGIHEWTARLPMFLFGTVSLIVLFLIAKKIYTEDVALLAVFIAATSPGIVYFSRNIQPESPMAFFSLSSVLFLMNYKDNFGLKWYFLSLLSFSLAILSKYVAFLVLPALLAIWFFYGKKEEKTSRILLYIILGLVPSLLWILWSFSITEGGTMWYFKRTHLFSIKYILDAFFYTFTYLLPWQLGLWFPIIIASLFKIRNIKEHVIIFSYTIPWFFLIFPYPKLFVMILAGTPCGYYDYPALYGLSILGALILINFNYKRYLGIFFIILIFFTIVQGFAYYLGYHKVVLNREDYNESEPFYSAKYVKHLNVENKPVLVDCPPTMFYAGGDPSYIKCALDEELGSSDKNVLIDEIKSGRYEYVVTYYYDYEIKKVLRDHEYGQIAPRAWNLERSEN